MPKHLRRLDRIWIESPIYWQREFFDHLLRSSESYGEKWNYVRDNPVRAGLVTSVEGRPHAGELERLEL
jgi:putative transposase